MKIIEKFHDQKTINYYFNPNFSNKNSEGPTYTFDLNK